MVEKLGSNRAQLISKNRHYRHYIRSVAEVLLLCSKQEISLRGHDESDGSLNKGNFLEILGVIAKHDPIVDDRLFHGLSTPHLPFRIISLMANLVRKKICSSVQKAHFYSLMVDKDKGS